jgi:hypothetical protein
MSLSEAIKAAREYRATLDPGDLIDETSGFSAYYLDFLIEWADTCGDAVAAADDESAVPEMDVTRLGDGGLAHFYFHEVETDPDLQSPIGQRLKDEIERRGLTDEQLAIALEHGRQQHEAIAKAEQAEASAPPHFPDELEIPEPR